MEAKVLGFLVHTFCNSLERVKLNLSIMKELWTDHEVYMNDGIEWHGRIFIDLGGNGCKVHVQQLQDRRYPAMLSNLFYYLL